MGIRIQDRLKLDAQACLCRISVAVCKASGWRHFPGESSASAKRNEQLLTQEHRIYIATGGRPIDRTRFLGFVGFPYIPKYTICATRQLAIPYTRTVSTFGLCENIFYPTRKMISVGARAFGIESKRKSINEVLLDLNFAVLSLCTLCRQRENGNSLMLTASIMTPTAAICLLLQQKSNFMHV